MFEDRAGTGSEGGIGRRGRATRLVAAGGVVALLSGFTGCFPHHDPPAPPDPVTETFGTAGTTEWVVPDGVESVEAVLCGGEGGSGNGRTGGLGGRTTATVTVSPGAVLEVHVGGAGGALPGASAGATGGFNGGGDGGGGPGSFGGAGGGGGTDLRPAGGVLGDRLVVAGGGGGGGYWGGGGGGTRAGGGGGSGFADSTLTSGSLLEAGHTDCTGDGFVTITYTPAVI